MRRERFARDDVSLLFQGNFHRGGFQSRAFVLGFLSRDFGVNFRLFPFSFQFVGEHGLHFRPIGFFVRVFHGDDVIVVFVVIPGSFVGIGDDEFHRSCKLWHLDDKLKPTVIFIQRVLFGWSHLPHLRDLLHAIHPV